MKRKHPSFLPFSAFFLRLAFQSVVRSSSLSLSLCIGAFESVCPFWQTELRVTRRKDLSATAANCEKYARAGRGGKRGTCAKLAVLQQEKQSTLDCLDVLWTAVPARRERERERERECNTFLVFRLMLPHRAKINAQYFTHAACPKCLTRFGPAQPGKAGLTLQGSPTHMICTEPRKSLGTWLR